MAFSRVEKKSLKQVFGIINLEEVKAYYSFYDKDAEYFFIRSSLSFWKKERGEWWSTGISLLDYFIMEPISQEEADELNRLFNEYLNDYFDKRYLADRSASEKTAQANKERYARIKELREKQNSKAITQQEAIELLELTFSKEDIELIRTAFGLLPSVQDIT